MPVTGPSGVAVNAARRACTTAVFPLDKLHGVNPINNGRVKVLSLQLKDLLKDEKSNTTIEGVRRVREHIRLLKSELDNIENKPKNSLQAVRQMIYDWSAIVCRDVGILQLLDTADKHTHDEVKPSFALFSSFEENQRVKKERNPDKVAKLKQRLVMENVDSYLNSEASITYQMLAWNTPYDYFRGGHKLSDVLEEEELLKQWKVCFLLRTTFVFYSTRQLQLVVLIVLLRN